MVYRLNECIASCTSAVSPTDALSLFRDIEYDVYECRVVVKRVCGLSVVCSRDGWAVFWTLCFMSLNIGALQDIENVCCGPGYTAFEDLA